MPTSSSIHLDRSRIIFLSPIKKKKPIKPFSETPEQAPLPLVLVYSEEDLQQIIRIVLKFYSLIVVVLAFNKTCERPLKARASNVYSSKSYIEYYNFCQ